MHDLAKGHEESAHAVFQAPPVADFALTSEAEEAEVQALVALADRADGLRRKWLRVHLGVALLIALLALPPMRRLIPAEYRELSSILSAATALAFLAVTVRHRGAAERASEARDPRVVGPLLDTLDLQKQRRSKWISRSLVELLPRMDAVTYAALSDARRTAICKLINGRDKRLARAALDVVIRLGSGVELPLVESIAEWRDRDAGQQDWPRLARVALPAIRERAARSRESGTLLRPAESGGAEEATLLRPAGSSDTDADTLLRPDQTH
jgi:hypothetical protein